MPRGTNPRRGIEAALAVKARRDIRRLLIASAVCRIAATKGPEIVACELRRSGRSGLVFERHRRPALTLAARMALPSRRKSGPDGQGQPRDTDSPQVRQRTAVQPDSSDIILQPSSFLQYSGFVRLLLFREPCLSELNAGPMILRGLPSIPISPLPLRCSSSSPTYFSKSPVFSYILASFAYYGVPTVSPRPSRFIPCAISSLGNRQSQHILTSPFMSVTFWLRSLAFEGRQARSARSRAPKLLRVRGCSVLSSQPGQPLVPSIGPPVRLLRTDARNR